MVEYVKLHLKRTQIYADILISTYIISGLVSSQKKQGPLTLNIPSPFRFGKRAECREYVKEHTYAFEELWLKAQLFEAVPWSHTEG